MFEVNRVFNFLKFALFWNLTVWLHEVLLRLKSTFSCDTFRNEMIDASIEKWLFSWRSGSFLWGMTTPPTALDDWKFHDTHFRDLEKSTLKKHLNNFFISWMNDEWMQEWMDAIDHVLWLFESRKLFRKQFCFDRQWTLIFFTFFEEFEIGRPIEISFKKISFKWAFTSTMLSLKSKFFPKFDVQL